MLDLFNPDPVPVDGCADQSADAEASALVVELADGRRIRRGMSACNYDRRLQCNECEMTNEIVETDGTTRRLTETFPLRIVYRYELEHLLARCGFRITALYGGYNRGPFTDVSLGMIAVAESVGA